MESGSCGSVDRVEIQMDIVGCVGSKHGGAVETSPVSPRGWRRIRLLKRKGVDVVSLRLGPSIGGASRDVGSGGPQDWGFTGASRRIDGDVGADILAGGECGGHSWCHERMDLDHSARQGSDGLVAACLVVSCRLSSRPSICPPPVRHAPGSSSFLSRPVPPSPAHFALDGDDVGGRQCFTVGGDMMSRLLFAGASVAQPCSSAFSFDVGALASYDGLHPAGSRGLPSLSVASSRRSVGFHQSKRCSASAHRGRGAAAASFGTPGVAPTQSSDKVILRRQVIVFDLGPFRFMCYY